MMKREGRQYGMVRSSKIYSSSSNNPINQYTTLPTCGITTTKVSSKPNNHSKFTSKATRDRSKGAGAYKFRSSDVGKNHRLISWRVVDREAYKGLNYVGSSASQVLDQLHKYYQNDHDDDVSVEDEDDGVGYGYVDDVVDDCYAHDGDGGDVAVMGSCHVVKEVVIVDGAGEVANAVDDDDDQDEGEGEGEGEGEDDVDDDMSFCDVGFVVEQLDGDEDGDEGWCLVGEM